MKNKKFILDACCGGRQFWFQKKHQNVLYVDNRVHTAEKLSNGQTFEVRPDEVVDFRKMPYADETFNLVVFDPPHLIGAGKRGWQAKKYGCLSRETWREDLMLGFYNCFNVLKTGGFLIFKWNEESVKVSEILKLTTRTPLFGHKSGKQSKTHWIVFMKEKDSSKNN